MSDDTLLTRLATDLAADRQRTTLLARRARAVRRAGFDLACAVLAALVLGGYAWDHRDTGLVFVAALVLHLSACGGIALATRRLVLLAVPESDGNAQFEARLAAAARLREVGARAVVALLPLLWLALAVVGAEWLFGASLVTGHVVAWLAVNAGLALAVTPFLVWRLRRSV